MPTRPTPTEQPQIDLEAISESLQSKTQWLGQLKSTRLRHEGALEQLMAQLQTEHNVDTIEKAEALLQRRQRTETRLLQDLQRKLEELQTIEQRIQNATTADVSNNNQPF